MLGKRYFKPLQDIKFLYRELCNVGQTLLTHIITVRSCTMLGKRY